MSLEQTSTVQREELSSYQDLFACLQQRISEYNMLCVFFCVYSVCMCAVTLILSFDARIHFIMTSSFPENFHQLNIYVRMKDFTCFTDWHWVRNIDRFIWFFARFERAFWFLVFGFYMCIFAHFTSQVMKIADKSLLHKNTCSKYMLCNLTQHFSPTLFSTIT